MVQFDISHSLYATINTVLYNRMWKTKGFGTLRLLETPYRYSVCFDNESFGNTENGAFKNPKIHTMPLDHNKLLEFEDIQI